MTKQYLEIERRWLLKGLPGSEILNGPGVKKIHATTVYVFVDKHLEIRVRMCTLDGLVSFPIVMKAGSGLIRQETPKIIGNQEIFDYYFMRYPKPHYLEKITWEIPVGSKKPWEIRIFIGPDPVSGLLMLEQEFDTPEESKLFKFPAWLESLVGDEVTENPTYNSKNLAVHGRPYPK